MLTGQGPTGEVGSSRQSKPAQLGGADMAAATLGPVSVGAARESRERQSRFSQRERTRLRSSVVGAAEPNCPSPGAWGGRERCSRRSRGQDERRHLVHDRPRGVPWEHARRADGRGDAAGRSRHQRLGRRTTAGGPSVAGLVVTNARRFSAFDPAGLAGGAVPGPDLCAGRPSLARVMNESMADRAGDKLGEQAGPRPAATRAAGAAGGQPRRHDHRGRRHHGAAAVPSRRGHEERPPHRGDQRLPAAATGPEDTDTRTQRSSVALPAVRLADERRHRGGGLPRRLRPDRHRAGAEDSCCALVGAAVVVALGCRRPRRHLLLRRDRHRLGRHLPAAGHDDHRRHPAPHRRLRVRGDLGGETGQGLTAAGDDAVGADHRPRLGVPRQCDHRPADRAGHLAGLRPARRAPRSPS